MNTNTLLESRVIMAVLGISGFLSVVILWSPYGLPALHKREQEFMNQQQKLMDLNRKNHEIALEVKRLLEKDPELMESLARQRGYAKPGETVYTFRDHGEKR
ncbi:MAG: septum formation initiator family protein [Holophagaceae bacterium]|nr:septum formation initiator family protein [Holophagaceae bacterium]